MEIRSTGANTAGLKFSQINASTPFGLGQTIGVNQNGDVVPTPNPQISALVSNNNTFGTAGAIYSTNFYSVDGENWTIAVNTNQEVEIPAGGKMVFINFVVGVDIYENVNTVGTPYPDNEDVYQAVLYLDGAPTDVFQQSMVGDGDGSTQVQYNLSAFLQLSGGPHSFDIRMKRVSSSATNPTALDKEITFGVMSSIFNLSYFN